MYLLQARDSVTGDMYEWVSLVSDNSDYPGPNSAEELAVVAEHGTGSPSQGSSGNVNASDGSGGWAATALIAGTDYLEVTAGQPRLYWYETDQPTDEKRWSAYMFNGDLAFATRADDETLGQTAMKFIRGTGNTVSHIELYTGLTSTSTGGITALDFRSERDFPTISLKETDQATDEKVWTWYMSGSDLILQARNDSYSSSGTAEAFRIVRGTGVAVDSLRMATTLDMNGNTVLNAPLSANDQSGTTYTLVASDAGKTVDLSNASAVTVTIPPNSSVAFAVGTVVNFAQLGAGQVTLAPGTGVTLNTAETLKTRAQYSVIAARKTATDTWLVFGDLEAA